MNTNRLTYILIGSIAVAIFLTVILILRSIGGGVVQGVTLQFWGVYDDRNSYDKIIRQYESQNPSIKVAYRQFSFEDYEKSLIDSIAANSGPDILMAHNTWLSKHGDKLLAMPAKTKSSKKSLFTIQDFKNQFVDVAFQDLTYNNQIYALPLYVDTLALYYNKDLFNSAGITRPPQSWDEFNSDVKSLTQLDPSGTIIKSAAAIGTSRNINRSTDILMALMIQSGVRMTNDDNTAATFSRSVNNAPVGRVALRYYTDFANPSSQVYTWNNSQHYSVDAFIEGKTAMMFNYSHQTGVLRDKASRLNFAVAPMPQISSSDVKNYANYWALGVSNRSRYPEEAWKFIAYVASREGVTDYLNSTLRPSARRDLIEAQRSDLDLGVFAVQALSARSWLQVDNTAIESIFADMIDNVNFKREPLGDALENAESRVDVLMTRSSKK